MGNTSCACQTDRRHRSYSDNHSKSKIKFDAVNKPKSATPYDNGPINSFTVDIELPSPTGTEECDNAIETPISIEQINQKYQAPNENPPVCFRSNLTSHSDTRTTASVFSSEDNADDDDVPKNGNSDVYSVILKEFLITHYPINNAIVNTMVQRNLLLPQDAEVILSHASNEEKSKSFLNNFVFSEVNLCKLATFLHLVITERSTILDEFRKREKYFKAIVDHIYYVVNLLSLLKEYSGDDETQPSGKLLSSMVNINSIKNVKVLKKKPLIGMLDDEFYAKIYITNAAYPSRFWKDFACINEHFRCCQDLTLSSCDLRTEDVLHLCQGFVVAGILRDLDISANPITDHGLKSLDLLFLSKNSLNSLNIACCSVTGAGIERLLDVISSNQSRCCLKQLNISHNELQNMTERCVLLLTKLPFRGLEMKSVNLRQQRVLYQSLKLNYSLKQVEFSGNRLASNDVTYLAAGLAYNTRLRRISLAMVGILKADCFLINNTLLMNKSLVSIDLSDNAIGDDGAEMLKDILTMKKTLKELYLRRCGISLYGTLILIRKASETECNMRLLDLCYNHSPRTSIVVDIKDIIRKIQDLIHHITLVKEIRILLWGTLDTLPFIHNNCIEF